MGGYTYGVRSLWETQPTSIDMLRDCVNLRMSASETAAKMAVAFDRVVTPNTVIGKARRLGIKFNSENSHNTFAKHGQGRIRPSRKAPIVPPSPKPIRIAIAAPAKPVEPPSGLGISLIALTRRACRWPTGYDEDGHHLFCGEDVGEATLEKGRCYCAGHLLRSYVPTSRKVNTKPFRFSNSMRAGVQS